MTSNITEATRSSVRWYCRRGWCARGDHEDRRLAMPPLDEDRARSMVDRLEVRSLLDGVRGQPMADVDALTRTIVAVSWLAHDLAEHLEAIDANPVICGPDAASLSTPS